MRNLLVILILFFPSVLSADEPDKDLHEKCIYPTVKLDVLDGKSFSTGVIIISQKEEGKEIYRNVGITVSHGVPERTLKVKVYSYKDWSDIMYVTSYDGIVYYSQLGKDIAIFMFITTKPMPIAKLAPADSKLYSGQEIYKVSCGLGDPPRVDKGIISGINRRFRLLDKKIQLSIYTLFGDSGSAIFNKNYEVVGILQSMRAEKNDICYNGVGFASDIKNLYQIIKNEDGGLDFLLDDKLPVLPWFEIKTNSLNRYTRAIPTNPWIHN